MRLVLISVAYWLAVAIIALVEFLATNFAGPAGTPIFWLPTMEMVVAGAVTYIVGLIVFRRRKAS